jgi:RES domain-containing protein
VTVEEWDAEQTVAALPTRGFRGVVWRTHWREVLATDATLSLRSSGRYHRGLDLFPADQVWPALYTSLAPEIAIWEMVRRSAARNLAFLQNNVLSEIDVSLNRVLDLSNPNVGGRSRLELTGPNLKRCQDLAAVAVERKFEGLVVPSAALPGSNLVIFPRNLPEPPPLHVVRSIELPLDSLVDERRE